jgi:DNA replication protein DnaC
VGPRREISLVAEAIKEVLGEGTHDLLARVERELERRGYRLPDLAEEPVPTRRCGRCGGVEDDGAALENGARVCRCGGRRRRLLSYFDAADPERRMTLDALDASEPTMAAALTEARSIVAGEQRRGMLLMGLPGRGKSHLMIALGRALLARDRDAGYYDLVRLVSRIQDTYCVHGGETRRAVVESVASHEVVLLDDLGKEHASTDAESIVYELFDALYVARTTLVVATNVPTRRDAGYRGPVLPERYDEAVRSRLRAMCERFVLKGEDRRREAWEW